MKNKCKILTILAVTFTVIFALVCLAAKVCGQTNTQPTITLQPYGTGPSVLYGLEVQNSNADQAIVTAFYHTALPGLPGHVILLSEVDVQPIMDGAPTAIGGFKWRGEFKDIAWVEVRLVKTVHTKKFYFSDNKELP
jgi:hypothetical protein